MQVPVAVALACYNPLVMLNSCWASLPNNIDIVINYILPRVNSSG